MASAIYVCTTKTHLEGARLNFEVAILLTFRYACTMSPRSHRRQTLETLVHEAGGPPQKNHGFSKATPLAHTDRL
eukprot:641385-Prymnesium_polylepis.1